MFDRGDRFWSKKNATFGAVLWFELEREFDIELEAAGVLHLWHYAN
ncbi:hypothetical protein [Gloeothece verrucosa]|nr:hypothetical protein [Gloeothece verrucosa]